VEEVHQRDKVVRFTGVLPFEQVFDAGLQVGPR
jgi:hypothetical protein